VLCDERGDALTIMRRIARRAGVKPGVHILRHTFCSHLAMEGAAPRIIQELAGHEDLSTTQRYMHLTRSAVDSAIALLDVRNRRGGEGGEAIKVELVKSLA
jgi:site-specific recombinase XerD